MNGRASAKHTTVAMILVAGFIQGHALVAAGDDCHIEANTGASACGNQIFNSPVTIGVPLEKYK